MGLKEGGFKSLLFTWCGGGGEGDDKPARTVHIVLAFFFLENYVLGTGFLGVPFAFYHSGLLYGAVSLIVITFVSWNCSIWTVETMARAQGIYDHRKQKMEGFKSPKRPNFTVTSSRKFEPSELSQMFMGNIAKYIYLISYGVYTFASSLSYATVAGASWSVEIPFNFTGLQKCDADDFKEHILPTNESCRSTYWLCLFAFACIVVPLSMLELKEQTLFQVIFGLMRFFTIATIIIYAIVHLITEGVITNCDSPIELHNTSRKWDKLYNSSRLMEDVVLEFDWRGWMVAIPIMIYSHNLHQGIPSLSHPVREKQYLHYFFHVQFFLNLFMYLLLGMVVPLWYRNCLTETVTLNWGPLKSPKTFLPLRILAYFVVIFPSLDVCSIFPLVVLCMVNNIYLVLFGRDTTQAAVGWSTIIGRMVLKFLCALTPILVAMGVSNLVDVLKYAGLLAFFTSIFFPTLLQLSSQYACVKEFGYLLNSNIDPFKSSVNGKVANGRVANGRVANGTTINGSAVHLKPNALSSSSFTSLNDSESTLLLGNHKLQPRIKKSDLYRTPYSNGFLSHPITACVLGSLGLVFFAISIASLFV